MVATPSSPHIAAQLLLIIAITLSYQCTVISAVPFHIKSIQSGLFVCASSTARYAAVYQASSFDRTLCSWFYDATSRVFFSANSALLMDGSDGSGCNCANFYLNVWLNDYYTQTWALVASDYSSGLYKFRNNNGYGNCCLDNANRPANSYVCSSTCTGSNMYQAYEITSLSCTAGTYWPQSDTDPSCYTCPIGNYIYCTIYTVYFVFIPFTL